MSSVPYTPGHTSPSRSRKHRSSKYSLDSKYSVDTMEDSPLKKRLSWDDNQTISSQDPYSRHQLWLYLQIFVPLLLVFIAPHLFALYVHARGPVRSPEWLHDFAIASPRMTAQIVTILSSFLTATTRWGLGGAAALLARKRLLKPRPIYEIEMFLNLKYICVAWDWKHRRRMMLLTWLLVATCGLLTSGFFTLLNPLPVRIITPFPSVEEVDITSNSSSCSSRYNALLQGIMDNQDEEWGSPFIGAERAKTIGKFALWKYLDSKGLTPHLPEASFVMSYSLPNPIRVAGATAGALVTGLSGFIPEIVYASWEKLPRESPSNYSQSLQGFWVDAKCEYDPDSLDFSWTQVNSSWARWRACCPGSSQVKEGMSCSNSWACIARFECPQEDGGMAVIYKSEFNSSYDRLMGNLTCSLTPRIGTVRATLDPDLQAFVIAKSHPAAETPLVSQFASNFFQLVVKRTGFRLANPDALIGIEGPIREKFGKEETQRMWLEVAQRVLQDMFEVEATSLRYELTRLTGIGNTTAENRVPSECLRKVDVAVHERVVGWEVKPTTVLGLLPLMLVSIIAFIMITLAAVTGGGLTLFDPTSPASLIGATSSGDVVFPKDKSAGVIGDPLDETVLTTKVFYGQDGRSWGLQSL